MLGPVKTKNFLLSAIEATGYSEEFSLMVLVPFYLPWIDELISRGSANAFVYPPHTLTLTIDASMAGCGGVHLNHKDSRHMVPGRVFSPYQCAGILGNPTSLQSLSTS